MGNAFVNLNDFTVSLGIAGGEELGTSFGENLLEDSVLQVVISSSRSTLSANSDNRVELPLDTPYEYTDGNLLIDISYTNISGSMYLWGWNPEQNRFLTADGSRATLGYVSQLVPVVVITGE